LLQQLENEPSDANHKRNNATLAFVFRHVRINTLMKTLSGKNGILHLHGWKRC
jgi:hypothetical protein